jgi:hypothetical protein
MQTSAASSTWPSQGHPNFGPFSAMMVFYKVSTPYLVIVLHVNRSSHSRRIKLTACNSQARHLFPVMDKLRSTPPEQNSRLHSMDDYGYNYGSKSK